MSGYNWFIWSAVNVVLVPYTYQGITIYQVDDMKSLQLESSDGRCGTSYQHVDRSRDHY